MTGPRSLHVLSSLSLASGGPTQSVTQLCEALNSHGAPAEIATVQSPGEQVTHPSQTPVHAFPLAAPHRLRRSPGLAAFLMRCAPEFDLIHVHGLWEWPGVCARRAATHHGMPLVISPRGMLEPWSLRQRALLKRLALWTWEGRNLAACSLLHATAEAEAHQFRALGLPQKTVVIPNAISVPAATLPARGDGGRKLLFLSRFHPKKGVDLLVQAWARVQAARPDWSLALHGPDQDGYMAQMQRLAESLGLGDDRIRFGGPLHGADKEALFRQADLFVLPTHSENFGNVVAEALSFGIPVITTTGAPWSGLQRHRCGWWIQPTRDALVAALEEALGLADQDRYRMGADGRAWMIREFSPEAVAGRMIAAYGGLLHPQEDKP